MKAIGLSDLAIKTFKADENKLINGSSNKINEIVVSLSGNLTCMPNNRATENLPS